MRRLNPSKITDWLLLCGFLKKEQGQDGKMCRVPTEQGRKLGLTSKLHQSGNREYVTVYYNANAQRFIVDHLDEILMK